MSASILSPSSRDRFELDRLAEELAEREGASAHGPLADASDTALPVFVPLARDNEYLVAEKFDVEAFLLSRIAYASLSDLRTELREYLGTLKEELVQLINDDYEAFISLSTDLREEGDTLDRLKRPLGDLKNTILTSRVELLEIQDSIENKLKQRTGLRTKKEYLHLLLKISESVTRLENLLLITNATDSEADPMPNGPTDGDFVPPSSSDALNGRGNRAKHLARVAAEYTQLLYHINKASSEKSVFIDELQWRVDRIKSTLSSDLDHLFSATIRALAGSKDEGLLAKAPDADKARLTSDMLDCLRTYDALGLWRDAEDVLRRDVLREFVKKTIFSGALSAPRSPMIPPTPFVDGMLSNNGPATASLPPRTPYTPFTAFMGKQNPFELMFGAQAKSTAHLLDEDGDPLAALYNVLLRFVDRELTRIMDAAERVCVKSGTRAREEAKRLPDGGDRSKAREESRGFDIMANVVWAEIGRTIMDELGSSIFASGKPDQFRKYYETTQAFIRSLEFLAPSAEAILSMRAHPSFSAFERRWQLPVYFQLRWKEIVTTVEVALSVMKLETAVGTDEAPFITPQASAVWAAITQCWSAETYIPELGHRFWKFTLQLLSRYKTWLDASLPSLDGYIANPMLQQSTSANGGTPLPTTDGPALESVANDNSVLRQLGIALFEVNTIQSQMVVLWQQELSMMLPEDATSCAEEALKQALASLTASTPALAETISIILSRHCAEAVAPAKSAPAQVRANKRAPNEPSPFVTAILKPVKAFFGIQATDGGGARLKADLLVSCATDAFDGACKRYSNHLTSWKKSEQSLRRLNNAAKPTFSLFGAGKPSKDDKARDDERIRTQMIVDVNTLGQDAAALGVDLEACEAFVALRDLVHSSLIDGY